MAAVAFVAMALVFVWLALFAGQVGGISGWIVIPSALAVASGFGLLAAWAVQKRRLSEPALIVDEAGLYDNLSFVHGGRIRWSELNRVWMVGPRWMAFLCIRPENVVPYIEEQGETKGLLMRLNRILFDAPVVIPLSMLAITGEQVWEAIGEMSGKSGEQLPGGLATR